MEQIQINTEIDTEIEKLDNESDNDENEPNEPNDNNNIENEIVDVFKDFSNMFKSVLNSKLKEFEDDPNSELGGKVINLFSDILDKTIDSGNQFITENITTNDEVIVNKQTKKRINKGANQEVNEVGSKNWKDNYIRDTCNGKINAFKLSKLYSTFRSLNSLERKAFIHSIKNHININDNSSNDELEDLKLEVEILKHKIATITSNNSE